MNLFYSTNTTGLMNFKERSKNACQPHIVQLAAALVDDKYKIVNSMSVIVQPDGWKVPDLTDEANTHGISHEYACDVGVPEQAAINLFVCMMGMGLTRISHSQNFHSAIMRTALLRFRSEELADHWKLSGKEGGSICIGQLAKPIMEDQLQKKYGRANPKLEEIYQHFTGLTSVAEGAGFSNTSAMGKVLMAIDSHQAMGI